MKCHRHIFLMKQLDYFEFLKIRLHTPTYGWVILFRPNSTHKVHQPK